MSNIQQFYASLGLKFPQPEGVVVYILSYGIDVSRAAHMGVNCSTLVDLTNRFVKHGSDGEWPEHALFGKMTGKDWGVFCHKHFNHHLSQFGV